MQPTEEENAATEVGLVSTPNTRRMQQSQAVQTDVTADAPHGEEDHSSNADEPVNPPQRGHQVTSSESELKRPSAVEPAGLPETSNVGIMTTRNPFFYALNGNYFCGLLLWPYLVYQQKDAPCNSLLAELWWRITTLLFAIIISFWAVYLRFSDARIYLIIPSTAYEVLPIDSILRDPNFFGCWNEKACMDRQAYCSWWAYDYDNDICRDPTPIWCNADCSSWGNQTHEQCGCGISRKDYVSPKAGSLCYTHPEWNAYNFSDGWCQTHDDCLPLQYCASCDRCVAQYGAELCHVACNSTTLHVNGTCDPLTNCLQANHPGVPYPPLNQTCSGRTPYDVCMQGVSDCPQIDQTDVCTDSIDGTCRELDLNDICTMDPRAPLDPLRAMGRIGKFCPNFEMSEYCLEEIINPQRWALVPAALIALLFITFFTSARKSYLRLMHTARSQDYSFGEKCSVCFVDILVPIVFIEAIVVVALTRDYPLMKPPPGAVCNGDYCDKLVQSQDSLHKFSYRTFGITAIYQFFFLILMFYAKRQGLLAICSGAPKAARVAPGGAIRLDLREYAALPDHDEDESASASEDPSSSSPPVQQNKRRPKVALCDWVLSALLVLGSFALAICSVVFAF